MKLSKLKNIYPYILVLSSLMIGFASVFAQGPPPPPAPPVGVIPWGPTELFALIMFGWGIYKMGKINNRSH